MTEDEYKEFKFNTPMISRVDVEIKSDKTNIPNMSSSDNTVGYSTNYFTETKTSRAVAIIGDRFMKGQFLPAVELEKAHKMWEGTLHDINHAGTNDIKGFISTSNILNFIGYNKNVNYDNETKSVSMDIVPSDDTMYASAWKAYIQLCEKAGQIPNVSVAFRGKVKNIKAKDLPEGVNYSDYGYSKDDYVEYIYDIIPDALSTVFRGACNDKDGCGVGKCDLSNDEANDGEDVESERKALIDWLDKNK